MANDNNQQGTAQQNTKTDGDIVGQLAANHATTKDVYLLEKGMSTTLNKIEKNQTKANTVLADIQREIKKDGKVISSVDTKLQQIITKITSIANASTPKPTYSGNADMANTTVNYSDVLNEMRDLLANINNKDATNNTIDYNGTLAGIQGTLDQIANINDSINNLDYADALDDINNTLSNIDRQLSSIDFNSDTNTIDLSALESGIADVISAISDSNSHLSDILDVVNDINNKDLSSADNSDTLNEINTNVLDIASYVNDCSSYLDEIRELLKNIDDRGASGVPSGSPGGSPTDVDSFADVNDTLLQILTAITFGNAQRLVYGEEAARHASERREDSEKTEQSLRDLIDLTDEQRNVLKQLQDFNRDRAQAEAAEDSIEKLVGQLTGSDTRLNLSSDAHDAVDGLLSNVFKGYDKISEETLKKLTGATDKWGTGEYLTKDLASGLGGALGDVAGGAVATAVNSVLPGLGSIVGNAIDKAITKASEALGEWLSYFANHARETRDALIKASLDKIKKDVQDMATYSISIQETALDKIYNAWDQNISTVNATQGYTKEALNTLQDSVAQRLQEEGYGNVINAADYATQLANTLNAKLGGNLAETFAAQNLILQKAVPEIDLSSMAADFAAIYTNAAKQGLSGEDEMVSAMNQIAGAVKALEQVTDGNNQFITQVGSFLKKAEEVVNRSGGTADQIADLTTQMMAAEAPLASLVPELSGFTNTMVDTLMKGNDSTAVALRAIMHDINANVGVSATDFMKSFVEDTQGTLATAYQAISEFISTNENEGARQEFLTAIESVFGLQASQVAQIDFAQIAEEIRNASTATNTTALTAAENLVRSGETTTWEDQLVNNTTNQLLATNAVRDTIDNKLMRKLEKNELELERTVYALESTQTVDFAEKTMSFFTNLFDIVTGLLDPLGLLDGLTTIADVWQSTAIDVDNYSKVANASSIGSTVTSLGDSISADLRTLSNTWGTAQQIATTALTDKSVTTAYDYIQLFGTSDSFREIFKDNEKTTEEALQMSAEEIYSAVEAQQQQANAQRAAAEVAQKQQEQTAANQATFDTKRMEALQQQRALQEAERTMTTANHDNIEAIRESVSKLDELSNYLSPILDENRNQSGLLQTLSEKMDQLMQTIANNAIKTTVTSPTPNVNTSYNERDRIYGPVKTW